MKYYENLNTLFEYFKMEPQHPLIDIRRYEDIIPLIPLKIDSVIYGFYKISFVRILMDLCKSGK
jgi:hypothetical protein